MSKFQKLTDFVKDTRCGLGFSLAGVRQYIGHGPVMFAMGQSKVVVRSGHSDFETLRQTFRDREYAIAVPYYENQLARRAEEIVRAGRQPVIVDAGANIGAAALWFAREFSSATIVAIEPDPENVKILRQNTGELAQAHIIEAALGAEAGYVELGGPGESWAVTTKRAQNGIRVITIDDAVASVPNGELFIAKIDIEGFEDDLFSAETEWMDMAEAIIVEPHDRIFPERASSRNFQREFARRDFNMLINGENIIYIRRCG